MLSRPDYLALTSPCGKPFRLALGCSLPTICDPTLFKAFAEKLECYTYEDIDTSPNSFGLPNCDVPIPKPDEYEEPYWLNPTGYESVRLVNWWNGYLTRAIFTARDDGGIYFNLAKYSSKRVALILNRYKKLKKNACGSIGLVDFIRQPWDSLERDTVWPNYKKTRWPSFTDWELAFVIVEKDCLLKTQFYKILSISDLQQDIKPLELSFLYNEYGIKASDDEVKTYYS